MLSIKLFIAIIFYFKYSFQLKAWAIYINVFTKNLSKNKKMSSQKVCFGNSTSLVS